MCRHVQHRTCHLLTAAALLPVLACAQTSPLERGKAAIRARTGCYLVDYSFVETEALKPGYQKDPRVYDVNTNKSVKEWIVATDISPTRIKLQHVLQGVDLNGEHMPGGISGTRARTGSGTPRASGSTRAKTRAKQRGRPAPCSRTCGCVV